ncbi:DUF397 domain-containing protein [Glycomyces sp. TRM65418]|uniref:DUF397 domain-containing protein n=1 Tax=Glycomyces sp. TRM65418 TaxID=2867006 RepID=UPI001CE6D61A|nr:DUF397 domain-containing protein [Glycomyces sp. TRM65418]MCC3762238.1 DUF397 domain-containing protein [Glycomyces sp. TRM65418]QZD56297.1 DUF397 domain-containing protein [Glycomyces sp. TRM65418]
MRQGGWRKSSRSGGGENACVEARVAPWRRSSRSGAQGNDCVEARIAITGFQVRDSKLGEDSPIFELKTAEFTSLLRAAGRS